MDSEKIVFSITIADLQKEAIEKIGRNLDDIEIQIARKGLESGIMFDIETIYNTILFEMIT